jgi:hypothetical protein
MLASFQLKSPRIALHPTCNNCGEYTNSNKCKRFYLPEVVPAWLRAGSPVTGAEDWPVATEYY